MQDKENMVKILLVADQIKNEAAFKKNLRQITRKSISDIRDSLKDKKPFYSGMLTGNKSDATKDEIAKILKFTNLEGDRIKLYMITDLNKAEALNEKSEVTQEVYSNFLKSSQESSVYLDLLEEQENNDE